MEYIPVTEREPVWWILRELNPLLPSAQPQSGQVDGLRSHAVSFTAKDATITTRT